MSGGKSSSATTTDQSVTDNRTGAEGEAVAIGAGANVSLTLTDPGAIGIAQLAVEGAGEITQRLVDLAAASGARADAIAASAAETDTQDAMRTMRVLGGVAIAGAAAIILMKGGK